MARIDTLLIEPRIIDLQQRVDQLEATTTNAVQIAAGNVQEIGASVLAAADRADASAAATQQIGEQVEADAAAAVQQIRDQLDPATGQIAKRVSFVDAQSLSDMEKLVALTNISAPAITETPVLVGLTPSISAMSFGSGRYANVNLIQSAGYFKTGDVGSAYFARKLAPIVSDPDDIVTADGVRFGRVYTGEARPEQFGCPVGQADSTPSHDCGPSFTAARDFLYRNGGGNIMLVARKYMFYTSFAPQPNVNLVGAGKFATVLRVGVDNLSVLARHTLPRAGHCVITELSVEGYNDRHQGLGDVKLCDVGPFADTYVDKVYVTQSRHMGFCAESDQCTITNSSFINNCRDAVNTTASRLNKFQHNLVDGSGDDSLAFHIAQKSGSRFDSINDISHNIIFRSFGIKALGAAKTVMTGNIMRFVYGYFFQFNIDQTEGLRAKWANALSANVCLDLINPSEFGYASNVAKAIIIAGNASLGTSAFNMSPTVSADLSTWAANDGATVTPGQVDSAGGSGAFLINLAATPGSASVGSRISALITASLTDGADYRIRVKARSVSGTGTFPIGVQQPAGGAGYSKDYLNLSAMWDEFIIPFRAPTGLEADRIGFSRRGPTQSETLTTAIVEAPTIEYVGPGTNIAPLAVYPGQYDTTKKAFQLPDAYLDLVGNAPRPASMNFAITNNVFMQTISGISNWSEAGYGLVWTNAGTFVDFATNGTIRKADFLAIDGDILGLSVGGNVAYGLKNIMQIGSAVQFLEGKAYDNTFERFTNGYVFGTATPIAGRFVSNDNLFNGDPLHELDRERVNGDLTGKWSAIDGNTGFGIQVGNYRGLISDGDTFRQVRRPIKRTPGTGFAVTYNIKLHHGFAGTGIALIEPDDFTTAQHFFEDSTPTSPTFGKPSATPDSAYRTSSSAMPTSGYYAAGQTVRNRVPAPGAPTGWLRLTTSTTPDQHDPIVNWMALSVGTPPKVTVYPTGTYTWTKDANAKIVDVSGFGSGSSGGGGGFGTGARPGGTSGSGAARYRERYIATDLPATVSVSVAAGPAGGLSGAQGNAGANTSFGTFFVARGAANPAAVSGTTPGALGAPGRGMFAGGFGSQGNVTTTPSAPSNVSTSADSGGGPGGGPGGGIDAAGTAYPGADGSAGTTRTASSTGGGALGGALRTAGQTDTATRAPGTPGRGGGGGGANPDAGGTGADGGDGGPGAGGGGGGAGISAGGKGGKGGPGELVVVETF